MNQQLAAELRAARDVSEGREKLQARSAKASSQAEVAVVYWWWSGAAADSVHESEEAAVPGLAGGARFGCGGEVRWW